MNAFKKLIKESLPAKILIDCINGEWDSYRNNYNRLTITDLTWIYMGLHRFVPAQAHYDFRRISEIIKQILENQKSLIVVELGCWRGYLAESLLSLYDDSKIFSYFGYDIDHYALDISVVNDLRFKSVKLTDWWYNLNSSGDLMLACHTIEHFNVMQLKRILIKCYSSNFKYLIWELPFCQDRGLKDWYGTNNTHILDLDRTVFEFVVKSFGYDFFYGEQTSKGYIYGMVKRNLKND